MLIQKKGSRHPYVDYCLFNSAIRQFTYTYVYVWNLDAGHRGGACLTLCGWDKMVDILQMVYHSHFL